MIYSQYSNIDFSWLIPYFHIQYMLICIYLNVSKSNICYICYKEYVYSNNKMYNKALPNYTNSPSLYKDWEMFSVPVRRVHMPNTISCHQAASPVSSSSSDGVTAEKRGKYIPHHLHLHCSDPAPNTWPLTSPLYIYNTTLQYITHQLQAFCQTQVDPNLSVAFSYVHLNVSLD